MRRHAKLSYAQEIMLHWLEFGDPDVISYYSSDEYWLNVRLKVNQLTFLPDKGDRQIVAEAFSLGCDTFLTTDRHTIWKYKAKLKTRDFEIVRPSELWLATSGGYPTGYLD